MAKGYIPGIGTGGGDDGTTPTPPSGTLADNEMLKSNVGGTGIIGTGDTNTDAEVNFGTKDITTTGVVNAGSGTFKLGEAHSISSGGENVIFTNLVDNDQFNPVWVNQKANETTARLTVGPFTELTQESSKADILINPSWISDPVVDWRVTQLTFESDTTITNVALSITNGGADFYTANLGTLTANVETTIDLITTAGNVAVDAFATGTYTLSVSSVDGDVRLKGSTANSLPFFKIGYFEFKDTLSVTENDYAVESLSTSLISPVTMTQNTSTSIDIPAGNGRLFDKTLVSWEELTNVAITDILTTSSTVIAIDGVGDVQQLSFPITTTMVRDYIILGYVVHPSGTLTDINNAGFTSTSEYSQILDLLESLGVVRKNGLKVNANADLTFAKTAGEVEVPGGGIATSNRGPNRIAIDAESPCTFARLLGITTTDEALSTTLIDPGFYDAGTGTKVAIPTPAGNSTIQYVYQSIDNPAGGVVVMYGQTIYPSLDSAVLNAFTDAVQLPVELEGRANLIARIAVNRSATDLTNTAKAVILSGVKFGAALTGLGFGQVGGGGDVFGPPSSPFANIVPAFGDTSGKTLNAASDIRMNSGGIIRNSLNQDLFLNTQVGGWIRVNEASAASTGIRIALQNSVRGTYGFDGPADSLVMQHGNTTTVPSDKDVAYFAMTSGGRHEMGTQRLELVRETEQTMQLLFTTGGTNRAGMHYIAGTSFNLRFGANPDPTGMDIFIERTQFNHPLAPKSYTTAERDALVLANIPDGAIIEHSTAARLEEKRGTAWVPVKGLPGPALFVNNATIAVPASADFTVPSGAAQFYEDDGAAGTAPFVGGVFTAPKSGVYSMSFGGLINRTAGSAGDTCDLWIAKNDASFVNTADTSLIDSMLDYTFYSTKWTGRLAVGDTLRVKSTSATATWNLENLSISITTEYQD